MNPRVALCPQLTYPTGQQRSSFPAQHSRCLIFVPALADQNRSDSPLPPKRFTPSLARVESRRLLRPPPFLVMNSIPLFSFPFIQVERPVFSCGRLCRTTGRNLLFSSVRIRNPTVYVATCTAYISAGAARNLYWLPFFELSTVSFSAPLVTICPWVTFDASDPRHHFLSSVCTAAGAKRISRHVSVTRSIRICRGARDTASRLNDGVHRPQV